MKKLIALFALVLPLAGQAEVTPLRCNVEKVVGAQGSEDLRPVNFKPEGEYRILPADDVLAMFDGDDAELLKNRLDRHLADRIRLHPGLEGAFIRSASENPKEYLSWTACSVSHEPAMGERKGYSKIWGDYLARPAHSQYSCENGDFSAYTLTNKFERVSMGDWITRDENSKSVIWENKPAENYYFEFGTCKPYYD